MTQKINQQREKNNTPDCANVSLTRKRGSRPHETRTLPDSFVIPEEAYLAFTLLEEAGYEAWLVGGFVRDQLLSLGEKSLEKSFTNERARSTLHKKTTPPDKSFSFFDLDIATNAFWQTTQKVFEEAGFLTHETGTQHGTLTVIVKGLTLEITTYRNDGEYLDARHPEHVSFVNSIEEDLARRDFTINAIAAHPKRGLLDPFGGISDIQNGIIRSVGNAQERFSEDALRILRGCRFASQLGFSLDERTYTAMTHTKGLLTKISVERIREELQKLLLGEYAGKTLLETVDILSVCLPELVALKGFDQNTPYHIYDVLEHTAHVVDATPHTPLLRWSALFHDLGKPATYFTDEAGVGHFYQHPVASVFIAHGIMRRLKFPRTLKEQVLLLVEEHDKTIECAPRSIKRAVRRLNDSGELFLALCDLKKADAAGQAPRCAGRIDSAEQLKQLYLELCEAGEAFGLKDLALSGSDVIALGVCEGPQIGEMLAFALNEVVEGRCENTRHALTKLLQKMKQ